MGVWRAHGEKRNIQTEVRFAGLPTPAPVSQATAREGPRPQPPQSEEPIETEGGWEDFLESMENDNYEPDDPLNSEESDCESLFLEDPKPRKNIQQTQNRPRRQQNQHIKGPTPGIRIASLNMRGRNSTGALENGKQKDKFKLIVDWMKRNKITILALIDTHWDEEYASKRKEESRNLEIYCSHETTNRGGVAFLIDTSQEKPKETTYKTLISGRSALLETKYEHQTLTIASVYVPNKKEEKIETIRYLRQELKKIENRENLVLVGDFNLVESEIDRLPMHTDANDIVRELTKLKIELNLLDGWRRANVEERAYTWRGNTSDDSSRARIDRIYINARLAEQTNEWQIITTERKLSDHYAVAVKLLDPEAPFIGKGECKLNLKIMNHPHFKLKATQALNTLEENLIKYRTKAGSVKNKLAKLAKLRTVINPQQSWQKYKKQIMNASKEAEDMRRRQITKERNELERKLRALQRRPKQWMMDDELKELRKEMTNLETEISNISERDRLKAEDTFAAKWHKQNESGSKWWYSLYKEKPKRQIFYTLIKEDGTETRNTEEMMEIAKKHHENLQSHQPMTDERKAAMNRLLGKVSQQINKEQAKHLKKNITYDEVRNTIKQSKNGKAPGCDGIPNEFWKQELTWQEESGKEGEERPDLAKLLKIVLRDIEENGAIDTPFAEARMSLLYKKKDIRKIENYRPITLLNTDYKIYTTILTKRLSEVAPSIINADQAGFMPKRSIYDQIKLLELTIKLSENRKQNGIILALDQEKAYDRIDHTYLWMTMEKYRIPKAFIERVKNLYQNAKTAIKLNGCITTAFNIERGVRQGDPLSCLLYNIAIEPLFEYIRNSTLEGIHISKESENVLVRAYADDTTVYLSENDQLEVLEECIDTFCKASTAKFNHEKTEIIPIGEPEFRKRIIALRMFNGSSLEHAAKIANEGEAIRVLGSWQGNNANANNKWTEIIEKQLKIMNAWAKSHPSLLARARIAKALVVSKALYLITVNGIANDQLNEMEKNIRSFIWLGKKGNIAWERAIKHKNEGGLGAPSVKILYETTKVMWIKRWMTPEEHRPKWAWVANEILRGARTTSPPTDENAITEWAEQKWRSKINVEQIPKSLREMIRTTKKYNLKLSVVRAPMSLKLEMPAFSHPARKSNNKENTKRSKCLRENHGIRKIQDMALFAENLDENEEEEECPLGTEKCREYAKRLLHELGGIWNPLSESPISNKMYHTPRRIEKFKDAKFNLEPVTFNPDPGETEIPQGNLRIFGSRTGYLKQPKLAETPRVPLRIRNNPTTPKADSRVILYMSTSVERSGYENSEAGIGIWHEDDSDRNITRHIEGTKTTTQRAELIAILTALLENTSDELLIKSKSLTALKAICKEYLKWENKNWHKTKNADILKMIIDELRTRPETCDFQWTGKANAEDEQLRKAKQLADSGRIGDEYTPLPETNHENSRAIHDGARLCTLEMKDIYSILIEIHTEKKGAIQHPERLEIAKNALEYQTGLRPTTEKIIEGIWKLKVYPRLRDLFWMLLLGQLKTGSYWQNIPGFEYRMHCKACDMKGFQTLENETHLWCECENNGQSECWKQAQQIWRMCTNKRWPNINIGIIYGTGALTIPRRDEPPTLNSDVERIRILIALATWAIWKSRNKRAMEPSYTDEAKKLLLELLKDTITKEWNATSFEPKRRRPKHEHRMQSLWGGAVTLTRGKAPTFDFESESQL
jgi:exonuclease III/ribonuclease HI